MTDTLKLKALLVSKGITLNDLSDLIGLSVTSLSYKINNKREFKSAEIKAFQNAIGISNEERDAIFFGNDVEDKSTTCNSV